MFSLAYTLCFNDIMNHLARFLPSPPKKNKKNTPLKKYPLKAKKPELQNII